MERKSGPRKTGLRPVRKTGFQPGVFSANGASSLEAWGIAPGFRFGTDSLESAEGATQGSGMNRAFSAGVGITSIPGALPQAKMNSAPVALKQMPGQRPVFRTIQRSKPVLRTGDSCSCKLRQC